MDHNAFTPVLNVALEEIPGAQYLVFLDDDGETIAYSSSSLISEYDQRVFAAHIAVIFQHCRLLSDNQLTTSGSVQILMSFTKRTLMAMRVADRYLLVLAMLFPPPEIEEVFGQLAQISKNLCERF